MYLSPSPRHRHTGKYWGHDQGLDKEVACAEAPSQASFSQTKKTLHSGQHLQHSQYTFDIYYLKWTGTVLFHAGS
jgi:hypothetical protein